MSALSDSQSLNTKAAEPAYKGRSIDGWTVALIFNNATCFEVPEQFVDESECPLLGLPRPWNKANKWMNFRQFQE